jgi:hypothetical protein
MKASILSIILSLILIMGYAQEEHAPYYKVADLDGTIGSHVDKVMEALKAADFEIIGQYNPAKNDKLFVIAYTRTDLQKLSLEFKDRGVLAATLKIGFVEKDGKTSISMLNPLYMFYAYLLEHANSYEKDFLKISSDAVNAMKSVGEEMTPFGGMESKKNLKKYRYKIMMPYFTSPVELNEFASFEEGLKIIRANLEKQKGGTLKVYEQVFEDEKIAVFGVGLLDPEDGEQNFLPKIGEENIAAMPYDIILQGNEATMLHGKFRIALHWPELTMGTFMKIMSTPGNIKDFMEELTK